MYRFKDLKQKHRALRASYEDSFSIRIHRSLSWLNRSEKETEDVDAKFIFLWISLNSAYSIHMDALKNQGDEELRSDFFQTLLKNGQNEIHEIIYERFSHEVRSILSNEFILTSFWEGKDDWEMKLKNEKREVQDALRDRNETIYILTILFKRLYVLRNQIFHGGSTWQGKLNRQQVKDGANLLSYFLPAILSIMMENSNDNWGVLAYPPTND
mgnify:FL=1|jgi:hypothetical protein